MATFEISDRASGIYRDQATAAADQAVRAAAHDAGIDPAFLEISVSDDGRRVVATVGTRSFEARVVATAGHDRWRVSRWPTPWGPSGGSRDAWKALDRKTRDAVIKAAKRDQPWPNITEARIALGWAWAVLGAPNARRIGNGPVSQFLYLVSALLGGSGGAWATGDIFAGSPIHDANPVVRRTARSVEAANSGAISD